MTKYLYEQANINSSANDANSIVAKSLKFRISKWLQFFWKHRTTECIKKILAFIKRKIFFKILQKILSPQKTLVPFPSLTIAMLSQGLLFHSVFLSKRSEKFLSSQPGISNLKFSKEIES